MNNKLFILTISGFVFLLLGVFLIIITINHVNAQFREPSLEIASTTARYITATSTRETIAEKLYFCNQTNTKYADFINRLLQR